MSNNPLLGVTIVWILLLVFFVSSAHAEIIVINSKDWKDVYSGVMYANFKGYSAAFLNSPNPTGLFNILPKDNIILLESKNNAMVDNFENLLKVKEYNVVSSRKLSNFNLELYKELGLKRFILVEEDYPYAAIIASPYAYLTKSWVFIVDDSNVNTITPIISGADNVLSFGLFKRSLHDTLRPYISKEINTGNKFKDSIMLANEFGKIKQFKQVLITDGKSVEQELLSGSKGASPALLVGDNLLPDTILDYIKSKAIKTAVVIGGNLGVIGERIRERTKKNVAVFIKFGQSISGANRIYALTMFPLPTPHLNLSILSASYDPEQKKIFVRFKNTGNVGVFEFTTLRIKNKGNEILSISDSEPVFIGAGEEVINSYDAVIPESVLSEKLIVEFYTSYGETVDGLEKYITSKGKYGPPLSLPLKIETLKDSSDVEITAVKYYPGDRRFAISIKNTGNVGAWASVVLNDVMVNGIRKSLSYDGKKYIGVGKEKEFYITARLDRFDLEENEIVNVKVMYGENKEAMIKSKTKELELEIVETNLIGMLIGSNGNIMLGVAIIIIIAVSLIIKKRR